MPVPVITPTTSALGYREGEAVNYQPHATNSPTGWSATGLPAGLSIDGVSGLISGTADDPGVFVVSITATNGTGDSEDLVLAIGIEPKSADDGLGIPVNVDLLTGHVSVPGVDPGANGDILFGKLNDQLLLDVGFVLDGRLKDLPISGMGMSVREFAPEADVVTVNTGFQQVGNVLAPRFRIELDLADNDLKNKLTYYVEDFTVAFSALAEFEYQYMSGTEGVDPVQITRSSQNFRIRLAQDFYQSA